MHFFCDYAIKLFALEDKQDNAFYLFQAIRDHNHIWCLLATGANQDGNTVIPMTTPSSGQQEALIKRLYTECSINPEWIQVIEAHGKIERLTSFMNTNSPQSNLIVFPPMLNQ